MSYQFTLLVEGADIQNPDVVDALFEAGVDDALLGVVDGVQFADFDRESDSLSRAVLSAVNDIESVSGLMVSRLADTGLVSMAAIANRTQRTRESVRLLVTGKRGPGGFPPPVTDPQSKHRLWEWAAVQAWFDEDSGEAARLFSALQSTIKLRHLRRNLPAGLWREMDQLLKAS